MAIGIILGIVLFIAAVGAFIWCGYCANDGNGVGAGITGVVGALLVIAFIIVPFSFHTIESGQVGVVKQLGKVNDDERTAGTHFDLWVTNNYVKYDATVQTVDLVFSAYSADAQTMDVAATLQYQIIPDKASDIATQYGVLATLQNRITSIATEKAKSELSKDKAMDIIANRAQMSPRVEEVIKNAIGDSYHVNVIAVVLTDITFTDAFEAAVEQKMIAEQAKLKAEYENQTKVAEAEAAAEAKLKAAQAEIDIAQAQADAKLKEAQAQKAIAEAEAEAIKVKAEAEAAANKILAESITPELLEKILAENWDGKLPDTYVGDGSDLGIILPNP